MELIVPVPRKHPAAAEMPLDAPDGACEHGSHFAGSEMPEAGEDELVRFLVPGAIQEDGVDVRIQPQVGADALQDAHAACLRADVALLMRTPCVEPLHRLDYTPSTEDGIRILILHDMEGLSGQSDPSSFVFGSDLYPTGQEWLAGDVNAVVDGLFAGGATEVLIVDGHGSGNPEPDLRSDLLDERATQIFRDERFDAYFDLPETETVDAVAVVGMHARTGSGGFASHTFTLGIEIRINGQAITETEMVALSWGRFGVPVIFASGDDRLENDLETMPWIEFVRVKDATGADSAVLRPVEEARADLRAGAQRAVENLIRAKSMRPSTPVNASLHAVPPASLAFLEGIPDLDYHDGTLSFVAADFREAFDGLVRVIGLATRGYASVLQEVIDSRDDAEEIRSAYREALIQRWSDQESGRYQPPEPASDSAPRPRRHFGFH